MYPSADHIHDGIFIKEQIEYNEKKYGIQCKIYFIDGIRSKFNYIKSIIAINYLLRKERFDLIHVHFGLSGLFLLFNPFITIPVAVTLHGSDIQSYKRGALIQGLSKLVVKRATRVIILNKKMAGILKKYQDKLVMIPCGINMEDFDRKRSHLHNRDIVIGFPASRFRLVKNYAFFQIVMEQLRAKGYKIEVVEFDGFTRDQVAANLSRLDCLVMTSFSEGSPQIIKEAMACGVPIVSANVGDVKWLLQGVDNCYVIDSFRVDTFVEKIMKLIKLEPTCRITNGKDKLRLLELDQETVCTKIYQLYKNLIGDSVSLQTKLHNENIGNCI
jgi:glycosyltransferase involved in cell wall biosynthesis